MAKRQPEYQRFIGMLRARGLTIQKLALQISGMNSKGAPIGRTALNEVFRGRRAGRNTWRVLERFLTRGEYELVFKHAQARMAALKELGQYRRTGLMSTIQKLRDELTETRARCAKLEREVALSQAEQERQF